jgi:plasmid maintenance system antidote protein VapI
VFVIELKRTCELEAKAVNIKASTIVLTYFQASPELWMNLQKSYDLDKAKAELGPSIRKIHQWKAQVGVH